MLPKSWFKVEKGVRNVCFMTETRPERQSEIQDETGPDDTQEGKNAA